MSASPELNPLFVSRRRLRESTRLRSNVADQVQRDLLPAGRLLSVFLAVCELVAEFIVLLFSWPHSCDRPLRFWVGVLMALQCASVLLSYLSVWQGRDVWSPHRAGLSASDPDMYEGGRSSPAATGAYAAAATTASVRIEVGVESVRRATQSETRERHTSSALTTSAAAMETDRASRASDSSDDDATLLPESSSDALDQSHPDFVEYYVRLVNAVYLVWYIIGSVWVSGGGTCHSTAPHLYRLVVALTIIYYAQLFLPLACFCLIMSCLPLFIVVYRIMLPYAERERRRIRAADPTLVQSLSSDTYSPVTFVALSGADSLEDASCVICLCDYEPGEQLRFLPCKHHFHQECVDEWLQLDKSCCLCKQDIDSESANGAASVV